MELEMLAHTNDREAGGKYSLHFFHFSVCLDGIVERTRQQKGVPLPCFLKLNNRGAKQRSRAAPCGTGDKIPAAAAAAPRAVIQKSENERKEGSMQKVIRHIWPTYRATQRKTAAVYKHIYNISKHILSFPT